MKKSMLLFGVLPALAVLVVLVSFTPSASALATVPYKMNFQGRLTDTSGNSMANGTYNMKFRIYDAASGGTLLWSEQRAASSGSGVTVVGGLFSVQLGDVVSLSPGIFNNANSIYFEIELPTPATATCSTSGCESYTEGAMTPRNKFGSSAYAFNADTLDGLDSASFSQLGQANTWTNSNIISANSSSALQVQNAASGKVLTVDTIASKVSIGTADSVGSLFILDTKITTGDPNGVDGAMYYNSDSKEFRCYENSAWSDCNFASLRSEWMVQEDFANISTTTLSTGSLGWTGATIGTGGTATKKSVGSDPSDYDRFGIIQLSSAAATVSSGWNIRLDVSSMTGVPSNMTVEFDLAPVSTYAAAGTNQTIFVGLHNGTASTAAPTKGLYFRYTATTSAGNWDICSQAACTPTSTPRTLVANQYQRFKIQTNSAGTSVEFFINEVSVGVISLGLPGANTTDIYGPSVSAFTSTNAPGSGISASWKMDYFQIQRSLSTLR